MIRIEYTVSHGGQLLSLVDMSCQLPMDLHRHANPELCGKQQQPAPQKEREQKRRGGVNLPIVVNQNFCYKYLVNSVLAKNNSK